MHTVGDTLTVSFRHLCSIGSLYRILADERFKPCYRSPLAGDSGINGYIEGDYCDLSQDIEGRGATLIIEWDGLVIDDRETKLKYPLPSNALVRQADGHRSVITAGTDKAKIKVVDFDINVKLTLGQRWTFYRLKKKLQSKPIYLTLKY